MNLTEATNEELMAELNARLRAHCGSVVEEHYVTAMGKKITATVAAEFGVSERLIMSRLRTPRVARARQVAMGGMWGAGFSYSEIGRFFGRDHTTVMHAVKLVGAKTARRGEAQP